MSDEITVTPEMIEAGWHAYWGAGLATIREKLTAAYRAMRALEPKAPSERISEWARRL